MDRSNQIEEHASASPTATPAGAVAVADPPGGIRASADAVAIRIAGPPAGPQRASTIATADGTEIYYKDWGSGQPIVFSHGWPLTADSWEAQMVFLASHGFRCIAHDRRGHGRSSQPWHGNEM